jgi:hypothetical protein
MKCNTNIGTDRVMIIVFLIITQVKPSHVKVILASVMGESWSSAWRMYRVRCRVHEGGGVPKFDSCINGSSEA